MIVGDSFVIAEALHSGDRSDFALIFEEHNSELLLI
jgi:hypothetical protein